MHSGKMNYWKFLTIILGFLLLLSLSGYLLILQNVNSPARQDVQAPTSPPDTIASPPNETVQRTFVGTIKQGSQFEAGKNLCAQGMFLVTGEGTDQMNFFLLKSPNITMVADAVPLLFNDKEYINKKVQITTKTYSISGNVCQAMTCECAYYLLINSPEDIIILDTTENIKNYPTFEGTLDCLPYRDTSQGQTLECTIGLKDQNGLYYGLLLNDIDIEFEPAVGDNVLITGTKLIYKMPDPIYKTVGTIEVVSITKTK